MKICTSCKKQAAEWFLPNHSYCQECWEKQSNIQYWMMVETISHNENEQSLSTTE